MASSIDQIEAAVQSIYSFVRRTAETTESGLCWETIDYETSRCRRDRPHVPAAHRVLHDAHYLDLATQAAEATHAYGDFRNNTTQCIGLSGCGELLIEMYRTTGDTRWRERAIEFALLCLHYRASTPEGDAWPTDAPGLYSVDYDYGASGVGHFFLRVLSDGAIPMPLM